MFSKNLDDITPDDIASLIEGAETERKTREYKRELPGAAPADKDKLRANATSLANMAGGDLIFGIDEVDEAPVLTGIGDVSEDEAVRHILGTLQYNIEPKLPPPPHTLVTMPGGERVLIVRIARSWRGPHFVKNNDNYRMYGRHSKGRFPMDASEIRQAIVASEELPEKILDWRQERLDRIRTRLESLGGPASRPSSPATVLHVVPWQSFHEPYALNASELMHENVGHKLTPMLSGGWDTRINLDGVLRTDRDGGDSCQAYRSGRVEIARFDWPGARSPVIPGDRFEKAILETMARTLDALATLGVPGPHSILLSLLNARGLTLATSKANAEDIRPIDRQHLILPDLVIEHWPADLYAIMRPIFDIVWNACGLERSYNYDENGTWTAGPVQGLPSP